MLRVLAQRDSLHCVYERFNLGVQVLAISELNLCIVDIFMESLEYDICQHFRFLQRVFEVVEVGIFVLIAERRFEISKDFLCYWKDAGRWEM